jgi:hypothetical protein
MYDALAMGFRLVLFTGFLLSQACNSSTAQQEMYIVEAPAGNRFCTIQEAGETIIPNGRIIRAAGSQYTVAPHPYGLTLSPDGGMAVTANSGVNPFSISLIKGLNGGRSQWNRSPTVLLLKRGF